MLKRIFGRTGELIANNAARLTREAVESICNIETAVDNQTFALSDGSLVSLIKIGGQRSILDNNEFERRQELFARTINALMTTDGHNIHFISSSQVGAEVTKHVNASVFDIQKQSAARMDLNELSFLIDAWRDSVTPYLNVDDCYAVVWTFPSSLSRNKYNVGRKEWREKLFKLPTVSFSGQSAACDFPGLKSTHKQAVNSLLLGLDGIEISANIVDTHHSARVIRAAVRATNRNWKPLLPGDPLPTRLPSDKSINDLLKKFKGKPIDQLALKEFGDCVGYPSISWQIFDNYTIEDDRIVVAHGLPGAINTGNRYHCPVLLVLPPSSPTPLFNMLYRNLINIDASWRMVTAISPNGLDSLSWRSMLSGMLHFSLMMGNKRMNNVVEELQQYEEEGGVVVGYQVLFDVWVDREGSRDEDLKRLSSGVDDVIAALQNWNSAEGHASPLGSLDRYWANSLPMVSPSLGTTVAAAPVRDVVSTLPLTRPAQVWPTGTVPFRSPDGRLLPYELFSPKQAAWIEIGVAPQGSSKSITMNVLNLAFILASKNADLPLISILDIGRSSKGLIMLLRTALGEDRQHEAVSHRLRNEEKYRVNPLDTPLGCRIPPPNMKEFLINFIVLLLTPLGEKSPHEAMQGLTVNVINMAYSNFEDDNGPKPYSRNISLAVDNAIDALGYEYDRDTSWFEIEDVLFKADDTRIASLAHRYAMPVLADLASIVKEERIRSRYDISTPGGEKVCDYFSRVISEAASLYPLIAGVTRFEIGSDAKIISLDLEEVAPTGAEGSATERKAAVSYMIGRQIVAGRFYQTLEDVELCPTLYKEYHHKRIQSIMQSPKRFLLDEYHRVSKSPGVAAQIESDLATAARETRKRNLGIGLYSHMIDDFPETILNLATSVFLLGYGSDAELKRIDERIGIGEAVMERVRSLRKPRKAGAEMIAIMKTDEGVVSQKLVLTLPSEILWGLTTVNEDAQLRDRLYARLSPKETLTRLSKSFPDGIKQIISDLATEQDFEDNDKEGIARHQSKIIDEMVENLTNNYVL